MDVAQEHLERLRWLTVLTNAVGRAGALDEIYGLALDCLQRTLGAERASILLFDPDGVIRFKAWRGLSDEYRAAVEGHSPWTEDTPDPEPIFVPDMELDPDMEPYRPVFRREGIRRLAFVPLVSGGGLLGKFMLYDAAPQAFDPADVELARIVANHVAFAVERIRREAELQRSQQDMDRILRHVDDAILVQDELSFRFVNDAAVRLLGFGSREALLGVPVEDVRARFDVFTADGQAVASASRPSSVALERQEVVRELLCLRERGTGEERWVVLTAAPAHGPSERPLIIQTLRDVTEQHRAEQEIKGSEDRARRAYESAKEAEARKDEFLAILGHELRNPLAPIVTALELMKLKANKLTGEEVFARERTIIERQVQHVLRLVDDLLDVSRITRGILELKQEPLELSTVVSDVLESVGALLEQRSHQLVLGIPRTGLPVNADRVRLGQVIGNLLINAAKYTDPGGRIELTADRDDGEAGWVRLRIRDNGIGIAPHALPGLFDLFVQGPQSIDRSGGGLGLGLTIVRRLVELHGGRVEAYSEGRGAGSEFLLSLPAAAAAGELEPDCKDGSGRLQTTGEPSGLRPARVLVVDDNVDAAETLATALAAVGYEVAVAYDGLAALRTSERFRPSIGVLDIGLPVMDGYELAQRLREASPDGSMQMLALTGYGQDHDRVRSREAGFKAHLVKPVDLDVLLGAIEGLIGEPT